MVDFKRKSPDKWILLGYVGVDSGTLMITDPCYVEGDDWNSNDYDEYVCDSDNISVRVPFKLGHEGKAVIFRSGFGDGCYPVYGLVRHYKDWGERIIKVRVDME